jgi:hypothetical protein
MTSKEEWLALAERCEKATGPDREIDGAIIAALGFSWRGMDYWDNATSTKILRGRTDYTASLDAITALIEREMTDAGWSAHSEYYDESVGRITRRGKDTIVCYAATPALALCAAFCRAMAEKVTA